MPLNLLTKNKLSIQSIYNKFYDINLIFMVVKLTLVKITFVNDETIDKRTLKQKNLIYRKKYHYPNSLLETRKYINSKNKNVLNIKYTSYVE